VIGPFREAPRTRKHLMGFVPFHRHPVAARASASLRHHVKAAMQTARCPIRTFEGGRGASSAAICQRHCLGSSTLDRRDGTNLPRRSVHCQPLYTPHMVLSLRNGGGPTSHCRTSLMLPAAAAIISLLAYIEPALGQNDADVPTVGKSVTNDQGTDVTLSTVVVQGHYDNALGTSDAASQGTVNGALLEQVPLLRPGEVLETVPGLVVTQHSGDGKANQYFLRGYSLDHGTDLATTIDGVPVNMPTNAHGQGYSDF